MNNYVSKSDNLTVKAIQWKGNNFEDVINFVESVIACVKYPNYLLLCMTDNVYTINETDYIIKDKQGNITVCTAEKFNNSFTSLDVKLKVMISQPMANKSASEIKLTREKAVKFLKDNGYEIVNSLHEDEGDHKDELIKKGTIQLPIYFLAKSLNCMSLCNAVYFCKGWEKARGCIIEHDVAVAYGLKIIYEM